MTTIRDPIHGSITINAGEQKVLDHPVFQRLRCIKQLGFTELAFPGATHTRYAHSVGALEVASRMFDALFAHHPLDMQSEQRLRGLQRLALLLHDIGHAPCSHASEAAMPAREALNLPGLVAKDPGPAVELPGLEKKIIRANHEDYTLKLVLDSSLTPVLEKTLEPLGFTPRHLAYLVDERFPELEGDFHFDGVNYYPLLAQIVSGELDADRMDYLKRDAYYAGVSYGNFDQAWLLENLRIHVENDSAFIALKDRAIMAFEDFLLSRYHMFQSVYRHYTATAFDEMLVRFYREADDALVLPTDGDEYAKVDDITLWTCLRKSKNPWAKRIVARQPFRCVLEARTPTDLTALEKRLEEHGIDSFTAKARGSLSNYYCGGGRGGRPIFVIQRRGEVKPIWECTEIYKRYAQPVWQIRIFVDNTKADEAESLL